MDNKLLIDLLQEMRADVKDLDQHLSNIDKTLTKQEAQIAYHIKRTNLLEEKIEPVQKHVQMVNGGLKVLGSLSLLFALFEFISKRL